MSRGYKQVLIALSPCVPLAAKRTNSKGYTMAESAITINRTTKRATIRTSHTWYSVSLNWLRENRNYNPLFAEALMRLEK